MTTIGGVFELPGQVHQDDFVLRRSEGVERAEQMLCDYMGTPQFARCFEAARSGNARAGASACTAAWQRQESFHGGADAAA